MFYIRTLHHDVEIEDDKFSEIFDGPQGTGLVPRKFRNSAGEDIYVQYGNYETACRETTVNTLHAVSVNHSMKLVSARIIASGDSFRYSSDALLNSPMRQRFLLWLGDLFSSWKGNTTVSIKAHGFEVIIKKLHKGISKTDASLALWILREPLLIRAIMKRISQESTDEEIKIVLIEEMIRLACDKRIENFLDGYYASRADFIALASVLWCREKLNTTHKRSVDNTNGPINALLSRDTWKNINFSEFLKTFLVDKNVRERVFDYVRGYYQNLYVAFKSAADGMSHFEMEAEVLKKRMEAIEEANKSAKAVAEKAKKSAPKTRKPRKTE